MLLRLFATTVMAHVCTAVLSCLVSLCVVNRKEFLQAVAKTGHLVQCLEISLMQTCELRMKVFCIE